MSSGTGSIGDFRAYCSPYLPRMRISSSPVLPTQATQSEGAFQPARGLTKRLDRYLNSFDTSFERVAKVRASVLSGNNRLHSFDHALAYPEQYKSRTIRALIHLAKHTEEIAEGFADISGLAERLTRNLISAGEKSDMALVIASAVGRVISGQLNLGGMAVHKVAGAALYGISSILSVAALGLFKLGMDARRTDAELAYARTRSKFDSSAYPIVAGKLLASKEQFLTKIMDRTGEPGNRRSCAIQRWAKYMSRHRSSVPQHLLSRRRANCNYIWQNLHQYGLVTQSLMHLAYGTFQGINKLLVSYDKHIGVALGDHVLSKPLGNVLGCRLGMTVSVGAAAAISVPMSPFIIGISTVGAVACGGALLALLLAKLNVRLTHDWKGNIQQPMRNQVFGKVTPTWP